MADSPGERFEDGALANARFYEALSSLDLEAMEELWMRTPWVRCIHPGWEPLVGWDAVRASWEAIFESTESHLVEPNDVSVHALGGGIWVSCLERISLRGTVSYSAATNLFVAARGSGRWLMVLHHASPIPPLEAAESLGLVH